MADDGTDYLRYERVSDVQDSLHILTDPNDSGRLDLGSLPLSDYFTHPNK